jgi:hypothetical protein
MLTPSQGSVETWRALGALCLQWGRKTSNTDVLMAGTDAYTKAIDASSQDTVPGLYEERGNTYAILGNIEEASTDYCEVLKHQPQNRGVCLSRAEVQIWAGRCHEARLLLETVIPCLDTHEANIIGNWLMCHALNLEGADFSKYKKRLEDTVTMAPHLNYHVKDIEPYLHKLDRKKFSEKQIDNAWLIQRLVGAGEIPAGS